MDQEFLALEITVISFVARNSLGLPTGIASRSGTAL